MYSCKSGFRLGGTLDFTVESDKVIDSSLITDRGTGLSSRAVRTMEGIKGTLGPEMTAHIPIDAYRID